MSADVMAMLARRWECSVQQVRERLTWKMQEAGLIASVDGTIRGYETGDTYTKKYVLGVTDDDRVAVLDERHQVLMWLD